MTICKAPWPGISVHPREHPPTISQTAAHCREQNIAAVIFPVAAECGTGYRRYSNDELAEEVAKNSDMLIRFASIDPWKGKMSLREARRLIREYGVKGFKFHPTMQGFFANDPMAYPFYEVLEEEGVIALFHTGQTGVGSGMPGGKGMRLKYANPMTMDDVAVDFHDLKITLLPLLPRAGRRPAQTQPPYRPLRLVAEISPEILGRYCNSTLKEKVLFGSDWPMITPERRLFDVARIAITDHRRADIVKGNAAGLLGFAE